VGRHKQADIVVASMNPFVRGRADPRNSTASVCTSPGDELSQELPSNTSRTQGYLRQDLWRDLESSVRGGIVDVFFPLMRSRCASSFWRHRRFTREFDFEDQRSSGPVQRIDILPMRDTIVDRGLLRQWGELARKRWSDEKFERDLSEKVDLAEGGAMFPGADFLLSLGAPLESTIFDYMDGCVLVLDEPEILREEHDKFLALMQLRFEQTVSSGSLALPPETLFLAPDEFARPHPQHRRVHIEQLGAEEPEASPVLYRSQPIQNGTAA
jgi:transcription-repair coupling factor (superfamily II helicase)